MGVLQATGSQAFLVGAALIPFVVSFSIMAVAGHEFVGYIVSVGAFSALGVLLASFAGFGFGLLFVNCGLGGLGYLAFVGGIARMYRRGYNRDFRPR